jgi:ferredoxin
MPFVPELFSAPALARLEEKWQRDELVAVPYFDGLMAGEPDALVESFAAEPELHDPVRGRVKGARAFKAFVNGSPARTPHPPAGQPGEGPTIQFARSNLAVPWNSAYGSLLDLAEACDVPVRWSCRTGVCHTCETTLIAGELDYNPDPVEPPADGSALICCSQPDGDVALDL